LGSVVAITDAGNNVVQSYDYDSFGMAQPSTVFANCYTYTGREWDKETGLYYYRARYYDPMEGRFISKDPIGFRGGDVNLYGYVQDNPINLADPMGLAAEATWGAWGAWGGAAEGAGAGASVSACGVLGGAAIIVAGTPSSTSTCADYPQPKECKDDKPCTPPEGTQCYAGPDTTHGHGSLGTHYHIFQMFKVAGTCQWQYRGGKVGKGVFETPPPGVLPCSSYPNFQGRGGALR